MSCTALMSTPLKKVLIGNVAQVFAQTAQLLLQEDKSKSERQKQSGCTVSSTGKILRQSRCHLHNYNKKTALNSRCFASLCERLDADHFQLLYHSEIRWLSRGYRPLEEQCSPLAEHYTDDKFCGKLAYLSDIFDQLNQLNVSMQGRNCTVFLVSDKIEGLKKKLVFWNRRIKEGQFDMFPHLSETLEASFHVNISSVITQCLSQLSQKFTDYIPVLPPPLDFGPILCGSCFRRHGSVHCVGK